MTNGNKNTTYEQRLGFISHKHLVTSTEASLKALRVDISRILDAHEILPHEVIGHSVLLQNDIDEAFHRLAPSIWSDSAQQRERCIVNAHHDSKNGYYPHNLYYSDESDRKELLQLFRKWIILKCKTRRRNITSGMVKPKVPYPDWTPRRVGQGFAAPSAAEGSGTERKAKQDAQTDLQEDSGYEAQEAEEDFQREEGVSSEETDEEFAPCERGETPFRLRRRSASSAAYPSLRTRPSLQRNSKGVIDYNTLFASDSDSQPQAPGQSEASWNAASKRPMRDRTPTSLERPAYQPRKRPRWSLILKIPIDGRKLGKKLVEMANREMEGPSEHNVAGLTAGRADFGGDLALNSLLDATSASDVTPRRGAVEPVAQHNVAREQLIHGPEQPVVSTQGGSNGNDPTTEQVRLARERRGLFHALRAMPVMPKNPHVMTRPEVRSSFQAEARGSPNEPEIGANDSIGPLERKSSDAPEQTNQENPADGPAPSSQPQVDVVASPFDEASSRPGMKASRLGQIATPPPSTPGVTSPLGESLEHDPHPKQLMNDYWQDRRDSLQSTTFMAGSRRESTSVAADNTNAHDDLAMSGDQFDNVSILIDWGLEGVPEDYLTMDDFPTVEDLFARVEEYMPERLAVTGRPIKELRLKSGNNVTGPRLDCRVLRDNKLGKASLRHLLKKLKAQSNDEVELTMTMKLETNQGQQ